MEKSDFFERHLPKFLKYFRCNSFSMRNIAFIKKWNNILKSGLKVLNLNKWPCMTDKNQHLPAHSVFSCGWRACPPLRKNPHFSPPSGLSCRAFVIAGQAGKAWIWAKRKLSEATVEEAEKSSSALSTSPYFPGARGKTPPVANFSPYPKLPGPRRQMPSSGPQ